MKKRFSAIAHAAGRARRGFTLIELIVVVGIVAMLITMASTGVFGALRQEDATRARNQLRDVLLAARQTACVFGRTQVVVLWNADTEIEVGNRKQAAKQGKYAVFSSVGNVWLSGTQICVPYGYQRESLGALEPGTRVISLADPDATRFAVIDESLTGPNMTQSDIDQNRQAQTVQLRYLAGGQQESVNYPMQVIARLRSGAAPLKSVDGVVPLAARDSQVYNLPAYYAFGSDRTAIVFRPDGRVETEGNARLSVSHSVASRETGNFSLSIDSTGKVTF